MFGTECFIHLPKQKRRKFDKKSDKGYLVGYCGEKDGYRIWLLELNKIKCSRDVIFKPETLIQKRPELVINSTVNTSGNRDNKEDNCEKIE